MERKSLYKYSNYGFNSGHVPEIQHKDEPSNNDRTYDWPNFDNPNLLLVKTAYVHKTTSY